MANTLNIPLLAQFGSSLTGQAANIAFYAYDATGTLLFGPISAAVEILDPAGNPTGAYSAPAQAVSIGAAFPLRVEAFITGQPGQIALSTVSAGDAYANIGLLPSPIIKTSYPAGTDLANLVLSLGVLDTTGADFQAIDLQAKVDAAIATWEEEAAWQPFLADTQDVTRVFDPPGPRPSRHANILSLRGGGKTLFLDCGLTAFTSLIVGIAPDGTGGTPYQLGSQFWLRPDNAPIRSKPWTRVDFLVPIMAPAQGISITGRWGYRATCPLSVWQAILQKSALLCQAEIELGISGGVYEVKTQTTSAQYAGGGMASPLAAQAANWQRYWANTLADFERLS